MRLYILLILFIVAGYGRAQQSDSLLIRYLDKQDIPVTTDNKVKLLKSGRDKFKDLFGAIEQAEHHIHMEYFNFRNDSIANTLFDLLAVKAAEGVKVRLLFDAFGNWSNNRPLNKKHLKAIRSKGIDIVKFDPINFPYINHIFHRDHRKIVVIDGSIGYTGGMNIADYYIEGLPKIGPWRDMHVRIEGSAVNFLQQIFLTIWNKETKQNVGGEVYFNLPSATGKPAKAPGAAVAIVDRRPRVTPKELRRTFVQSIRSAQTRVLIVNPYFVPTNSIKKEIKDALRRGVNVEIMISSKSDISFTPDASFYVSHNLVKEGARVYMYNGGFHHSKIMMVDDKFCTVGSANLDSRSLRWDYETNAFIFDKKTTAELVDMFREDKKNSTLMTEKTWKKRTKWKRFVGWFAHLFTPFL